MRLQKYLAHCGLCSRRAAEQLILDGKVFVNGKKAELGIKVEPGKDTILVDGKPIAQEIKRYILLNKPEGYVCTSKDRHAEKTVQDLIDADERLYTVGRLDKDTQGLILLTNDGEITHRMTHPSFKMEKTYEALVQGVPTSEELNKLHKGVMIAEDDEGLVKVRTAPCKVRLLSKKGNDGLMEITISEGKKRQVRKMFRAVGHPVKKLRRVREGGLNIEGLAVGEWRELSKQEVKALYREVGLKEKKEPKKQVKKAKNKRKK